MGLNRTACTLIKSNYIHYRIEHVAMLSLPALYSLSKTDWHIKVKSLHIQERHRLSARFHSHACAKFATLDIIPLLFPPQQTQNTWSGSLLIVLSPKSLLRIMAEWTADVHCGDRDLIAEQLRMSTVQFETALWCLKPIDDVQPNLQQERSPFANVCTESTSESPRLPFSPPLLFVSEQIWCFKIPNEVCSTSQRCASHLTRSKRGT